MLLNLDASPTIEVCHISIAKVSINQLMQLGEPPVIIPQALTHRSDDVTATSGAVTLFVHIFNVVEVTFIHLLTANQYL